MEKRKSAIPSGKISKLAQFIWARKLTLAVGIAAVILSAAATTYYYHDGTIIAYGDAESHLNISKRVVDSLTPGLAQLGGIWLPLPHLLMAPLVSIESLYRSGIAGAIVSGAAYVISSIYIYKLGILMIRNRAASLLAAAIFMFNPNILYMQTTAMTEVLLISFFAVSNYYFFLYLMNTKNIGALIVAAITGFAATLTRYDGWFLVLFQSLAIGLYYLSVWKNKERKTRAEGQFLLYSTAAFFGILLWFIWGYIILNDPLYFTNSPFSAKSQQQGWLARGELPAYKDLENSVLYYVYTSAENIGKIISFTGAAGIVAYLLNKDRFKVRFLITLLLLTPLFFYIVTLYMGQSVIFIPSLTPETFEWRLFNVRYGMMMIPIAALFTGYLYWYLKNRKSWLANSLSILIPVAFILQSSIFARGEEAVITYEDAVGGLSSASSSDAQQWLAEEYDGGLVLMDDYSRTLSVIRSGIPMENVIYIGNKPYWEESLVSPEKHARWIIMQQNDSVWSSLYTPMEKQAHVYKYYERTYTSPEILIFRIKDEYQSATEIAEN